MDNGERLVAAFQSELKEGNKDRQSSNAETTEHKKTQTKVDIFIYSGGINRQGYQHLCNILNNEPPENGAQEALLILGTSGGDADAAFRIARALHHHYPKGFGLLIPGYCKSAGTLIAIGAKALIIADEGELGPLDVQISKRDELFERSSGLDLPQAFDYLGTELRNSFKSALIDIKLGGGLSTSIAAKIATELMVGTFAPIYAQIDPAKIGETQRANMIAYAYGERLAHKSGNLKPDGLAKLLYGYPSHSFVIDRKEARDIFDDVDMPSTQMLEAFESFSNLFKGDRVNGRNPFVTKLPVPSNQDDESEENGEASDAKPRSEAVSAPAKRRAGKKGDEPRKTDDN